MFDSLKKMRPLALSRTRFLSSMSPAITT